MEHMVMKFSERRNFFIVWFGAVALASIEMLSIPSVANVTNAEFIRDVALCIRSFHVSDGSVPLSKFCERFEEIIGYSMKEHLEECRYSFSAVIRQVLRRTRIRCEYDAHQEIIILDPEKYNSTMNYNDAVRCNDGDQSSTTSSCYATPCESSLLDGTLNASTNYTSGIDGDTSVYYDASEGSSFYHSFDSKGLSKDGCGDSFIFCFEDETPNKEEQNSNISPELPMIFKLDLNSRAMQHENEQMVYRGKFMVEHSPCLQIECHSIKRQDSEDLERKRLEEEDIIEERYTDWNTHDVFELPPSVADAHESQQSSAPSLEGKEFCTEHMRYEQMVYGGKITVEPSHLLGVDMERNRLESLTLTTLCDSNQSEEIHPRRSSSYSSSEEEVIIEEGDTDWNAHDVHEVSASVADAHESQQSSAPSLEEKEICTEHMRYEQMVYRGKITVEPSHLLGVDVERNRLERLTLTAVYDSNQSAEENHRRRYSSYSSSSCCCCSSSSSEEKDIEQKYTDWNAHDVHEVSSSVESQQSSAPSLEEKEICTGHMRHELVGDGGKITVELSHLLGEDVERNRLESLALTAVYDSNQSEESHRRRYSFSSSSSSYSSSEEKDIEHKYTDWNAHDVHEVSSSVQSQQSSAPSLEEQEICTGHMRYEPMVYGGKITVEPSHLLGEDVERNRMERLTLKAVYDSNQSEESHRRRYSFSSSSSSYSSSEEKDIEQRYTDWNTHDVCEVPPSVADAHESQQSSAPSLEEKEISTDHMRIQMKNTCISLWSDKVQQLPELLYILKLCHNIYGPLSITSCEEIIESCVNPDCERNRWPLMKHGVHMDVKRMFELKMFRLSKPPNRMEVQPVDCILMSKFHMLLRGLISEVYEVLLKSKKGKTLKEVMEMMTAFLKASDDFSRLDEIKKAILTVPEVIRISDDYLELCNDDAFFVITDVDIQPSGMTSSDNS